MAGIEETNNGTMKRKPYEKELRKLQVELCHLQDWAKAKGLRAIVLFEGRDAAGKGGTIKALTERVMPAGFPSGRTASALRSGKDANVSSTLHRAVSRRRRNRHFRPQLVQSRRCRESHGFC